MKRVLILMLLLIIFTATSQAATYVWEDVIEADWNSPNWTVGVSTGQYPNDVIADNNSYDHLGDDFLIEDNGSSYWVTSIYRIRIEGGTLTVDNSTLHATPTTGEDKAGLIIGGDMHGDGNMDANLVVTNGATLKVSSIGSSVNESLYVVRGDVLLEGGSTLDIEDNPDTSEDAIRIDWNARFEMTGNSTIVSNSGADGVIRLNGAYSDGTSYFKLVSGTITLDSNNPIRTTNNFGNIMFNWTGDAGDASLTASNNNKPNTELANKIKVMGIDDIKPDYSSIPSYNYSAGTYGNLADVNSYLEARPIHGRYFFFTATGNQSSQTLQLADTNQPNVDENPEDAQEFPGDAVDFNCLFWSATAPVTAEVVWELNGSAYPVDDTIVPEGPPLATGGRLYRSTLSIASVDVNDEGTFVCTISVPGGDVNSAPADLVVKRQMAHWKFDGDPCDACGIYDLDVNGAPTYATGVFGQAIVFDGNEDYAAVDISPTENWTTGFTISLWVKTPEPNQPQYKGVFSMGQSGQIDMSGNSENYRYRGPAWLTIGDACDSDVDANWTFLVVTSNGTNETKCYYDGVNSVTNDQVDVDEISQFVVGANRNRALRFEGSVDDVQVWNYPLDKFTIYDMYYAVYAGDECLRDYAEGYDLAGPDGVGVKDCVVDLYDLSVYLDSWLDCGLNPTFTCP